MPIPNPEHLFDQAKRILASSPSRRPRQADLRQAISTAYYCLFHATLAAAADQVVGRSRRTSPAYGLVYRSVDHRVIRELCQLVIGLARYALTAFEAVPARSREAFLSLLLFSPR